MSGWRALIFDLDGTLVDTAPDIAACANAVVTNKPHPFSVRLLEELDLARHFRRVIGMHAGFLAKPDPAGVRDVLDALGCPAGQALMVGDSRVDYETARNAGTDFAWVSYGYEDAAPAPGVRTFARASEWREIADGAFRG